MILRNGIRRVENTLWHFFSTQATQEKTQCTTVEKECTVIVVALKHFVANFLGGTFVIQLDQQH